MRYLISTAALVLTVATATIAGGPAAANAATSSDPAIPVNTITRNEVWASYTANFSPQQAEREQVLTNLEKVCSSDRRTDKRRCARAWHIIDTEYAKLQERKAAEAED